MGGPPGAGAGGVAAAGGGGGLGEAVKTWGRDSLRASASAEHCKRERTSAKEGGGRMNGMKAASVLKSSPSPWRRILMS
jgi:hypothetical protein